MRKSIAWWFRGAGKTPGTLDEHAAAIRDLQHKLDHLTEVVARLEPIAVRADNLHATVAELAARLDRCDDRIDRCGRRIDQVDETLAEIVRLVAPPRTP